MAGSSHKILHMISKNDKPLKDVLQAWLKDDKVRENYFQAKLEVNWHKITSQSIRQYTTDIKLKNKVLFLRISSAPLRNELHMGREQLRKNLNEFLNENYIKEVQFLV